MEIDAKNTKAWIGKGVAILYSSRLGNLIETEAISYFQNVDITQEEAVHQEIIDEITRFTHSAFVGTTYHSNEFKNTPDAAPEHTERLGEILALLTFAEGLNGKKMLCT